MDARTLTSDIKGAHSANLGALQILHLPLGEVQPSKTYTMKVSIFLLIVLIGQLTTGQLIGSEEEGYGIYRGGRNGPCPRCPIVPPSSGEDPGPWSRSESPACLQYRSFALIPILGVRLRCLLGRRRRRRATDYESEAARRASPATRYENARRNRFPF